MTRAERAAIVLDRVELRNGELWWTRTNKPVKCRIDRDGYHRFQISISGVLPLQVAAHRVVWLLHHGDWPQLEIDHINRDPGDNRIENLRDVGRSENARNRAACSRLGVGVWRDRSKWRAEIQRHNRIHRLGSFATREEAIAARVAAEQELARVPFPSCALGVIDPKQSRPTLTAPPGSQ